jgi:arylsulfatase A-like enzyme
MLRDWQKLDRNSLDPASQSLARDAYDDCLASLDRELGKLFDELRRRDVLDQTLLILTADHGEQFGEHGAFGHGMSLYEPEVHVPLIVVSPGRVPRGVIVDEAVSLRDVPATVADLVVGAVPSPFPGTPLTGTWSGSSRQDAETANAPLSELDAPIEESHDSSGSHQHQGPCRVILAGRTTYLQHGDGTEELYDLENDPAESRNLIASADATSLLARCRRLLGRLTSGVEAPNGPIADGSHLTTPATTMIPGSTPGGETGKTIQ